MNVDISRSSAHKCFCSSFLVANSMLFHASLYHRLSRHGSASKEMCKRAYFSSHSHLAHIGAFQIVIPCASIILFVLSK